MDLQESGQLVALLKAIYPHFKADESTIHGYHFMLEPVPYRIVEASLREVCKQHPDFPPTAPQLLAHMERALRHDKSPEEAWAEVMDSFRQGFSSYNPPPADHWSSPQIARVVAAIGWNTICFDEKPQFLAKRFADAYRRRIEDRKYDDIVEAVKSVGAGNTEPLALGD